VAFNTLKTRQKQDKKRKRSLSLALKIKSRPGQHGFVERCLSGISPKTYIVTYT